MANLTALVVPELGESITEAVVGRWLKTVGEAIAVDEPIVDLETDKITMQVPSPVAGALTERRFSEGDTVSVGDVLGQIDVEATGTQAEAAPTSATVAAAVTATTASVIVDNETREKVVPMTPLRKRIAQRLVRAQQSTASLTTFNEVDMTNCVQLRKKFQEEFVEVHGIKLGFMSFFVKAAVAALKLWPGLNAEIRGEAIVYKSYYDIGIAVGTDRGLIVPVLRGVDSMSFADIERGIDDLAKRARERKLELDDLANATFTISNGGVYGSMMSTPLLNYPQTGILGMHNIVRRPVAVGDTVEVRPVMYIAVTYDHRVVDGLEAVSFTCAIKDRVENPDRLLFEV